MSNDSSAQIVHDLTAWIADAAAGSRLPSTRDLTTSYRVSPLTVQKALATLTGRGLIESRPGVGTFVRHHRRAVSGPDLGWQSTALGAEPALSSKVSATQRAPAPETLALHSGYPHPDLLPLPLVRAAIARASKSPAALERSPIAGLPELRSWFAAELAHATPSGVTPVGPHNAIVLPGTQSGLSSVFRSIVGAGRPMVIESPTFWGAILAAAQAGVTLIPIPSGPTGPEPADLDDALRRSGARAFYAQPTYANPTGAQWTPERSAQVTEVARAHGAFLIEDDWARDLGIDTDPRPLAVSDTDGRVIYLRSLTKSVSPALRVGVVIARGTAHRRILADRAAEGMYVSGVLQSAALDVVTRPGWSTHRRNLRGSLRLRRDTLVAALRAHVPDAELDHVPAGGLNLWLRLPEGIDVDRLAADCDGRGVAVAPGCEWFPTEPPAPYLRLGFAGADPARFAEAARIIGAALADHR